MWEEIECSPFQCHQEQYVVCLDTLGQDREFTNDEKRLVLNTVQSYIRTWEAEERKNLEADRDRKLELLGVDVQQEAENLQTVQEQIERKIESALGEREDLAGDEELKDLESRQKRL